MSQKELTFAAVGDIMLDHEVPKVVERKGPDFPFLRARNLKWDLLLLHTVEAGGLGGPAEYRTSEIIENLRLEAGNIIYDNGASFIISNTIANQD